MRAGCLGASSSSLDVRLVGDHLGRRTHIRASKLKPPVLGVAAYLFVKATEAARARAPRDWRLAVWCVLVFPIIGLLAIPFPQLLGNGKGLAQAGF